uniref:VWFA domain-containing protein n=1 Tax=Nomascus leucogenys TaxID=61853 RepID=A0A2I3FW13_NOMLE
ISRNGREEGGRMVLESTIVCVDNSEYLQAQQDAVNIACHSKPANNMALITLADDYKVLTTLTADTSRILSKLHTMQPKGKIAFCTGIHVAHLALNEPEGNEKDLVKLAKFLKKEKVNVDMMNFGEEEVNTEKLTAFVNTLNGKDGSGSHLVAVPPGPSFTDALISSPILAGEGGAMLDLGASDFEFGIDPSGDPELALQQQWQKGEIATTGTEGSDEALLKMTISQQEFGHTRLPDLSSVTEEEEIACVMQGAEFGQAESADIDASSAMDTSEPAKEEDDYDVMQDPEFLQSVLENLPGMDPNNEATKDGKKDKKEEDKK